MFTAKGRTNCQAEREIVIQGFREQIQILQNTLKEQETAFKAQLYDIITDTSITDEEKTSLQRPWINELEELEERHIRIRRSVFIGLYSFWEVSLMDMANTHIPAIIKSARKTKNSHNFGASDYLKSIYQRRLTATVSLIDSNIREFRNYMVHGALTKKRESLISVLAERHKEFYIKGLCKDYFISNYKGIIEFLNIFANELDQAENKILEIKNVN